MTATHDIVIHIDRQQYKVEVEQLTGQEIRGLPEPDIASDRDLYLELAGRDPDVLVADDQVVQLKNGMHFFTAPREINPG